MLVRDVMTTELLTVRPDEHVRDVVKKMFGRGVSGVPVVGWKGELVGIVSDSDLLRPVLPARSAGSGWAAIFGKGIDHAAHVLSTRNEMVQDVMTVDVRSIAPGASLADCVDVMQAQRLKRLVVLDGRKPVGIVSRSDLFRAMASRMFTMDHCF